MPFPGKSYITVRSMSVPLFSVATRDGCADKDGGEYSCDFCDNHTAENILSFFFLHLCTYVGLKESVFLGLCLVLSGVGTKIRQLLIPLSSS